jgi:hypothetical protein
MAGLVVAAAPVVHRQRGVVRIQVALTCDASGVVTAAVVGNAHGRLVGFLSNAGLDASAVVTVRDFKTGAPIFVHTQSTEGTPVYLSPTDIVTDNAGVNITAADTAPNVNRDIMVAGKLTVGVTAGGNAETATIALIIDEANLQDGPALTV